MIAEKFDGAQERRVLIGMIVDVSVVSKIATKWKKDGLFANRWANLVGSWAVEFFNRYGKAPGKAIEGLFESWCDEVSDKETAAIVESFLTSLSGEYVALRKEANSQYTLDLASTLFDRIALQKHAETIQGYVDRGDLDKAKKKAEAFLPIAINASSGIDVLQDLSALELAFIEKKDPLINYPGDCGKFFEDVFEHDSFVSFLAPEKRGKSFWLLDAAWRGMKQRKKVAFFSVGDMSQSQVLLRLAARAANRPVQGKNIKFPVKLTPPRDGSSLEVIFEEREYAEAMSVVEAKKAFQRAAKTLKTNNSLFRLAVHPNSSINVLGIQSQLETWDKAGWIPDIVIIDYADILASINGSAETRDQINATWKALRALSQSRHCCVITATQSDAASYNAEIISRSNFSEDKRKLAHVTAMIGINQNKEEKELGVMRLNMIARREGEYLESKCVYVAGCLAVCNPVVLSAK